MKMSACIIIPAYQPNQTLLELIGSLFDIIEKSTAINTKVIVVDDGSTDSISVELFAGISATFRDVILLQHANNLGKGAALKTGFSYIQENCVEPTWVVTADADGQHLPSDIWKIVQAGVISKTPTIGVRAFDIKVPFRSRFGNSITKFFFNATRANKINDTQSGLRGFNSDEISSLLDINSSGYAFELDALIYFTKISKVREIPITTVYEPGNPTSHFHPILDSAAIYAVLFRQIFASTLAMLAEVSLFTIFSSIGFSTALALPMARFIAGSALFLVARDFVFRSGGNLAFQAVKYISAVIANLFIAVMIIDYAENSLGQNKLVGLFSAYIIMFLINFLIQKYFIFFEPRQYKK